MFIKIGPKQTELPVAALVPNLITTLAMCSGLASIHFSLGERWEPAVAAIAMSMVFDALDGRAARLLRVSSKFGAVLDSLSDFVSFGVAPAVILHQWLLKPAVTPVELAAVMVYAVCAGLRLARFTAAVPASKPVSGGSVASSNYFTGMPTPAAASAVLIPAMYRLAEPSGWQMPQWVISLLAIVIGLLMVSTIPTFAFKKLTISRRLVVPLMILFALFAVTLITHFWLTLVALSTLNLALIPWSWWRRRRTKAIEA